MSERLSSWHDLWKYGFDYLTGEACGIGLRGLVDIYPRAYKILCRVFGVKEIQLSPAWNSGETKVGSIMLPKDLFGTICIFSLLDAGYTEVWQCKDGSFYGVSDEDIKEYNDVSLSFDAREAIGVQRVWRVNGTAGDRNIHQMSGRVT
jgi:hypothetical protein